LDLSTFIIVALFCLIDDRLMNLGRLGERADPLLRSRTLKSSPPPRSSASSWGSTKIRGSSATSPVPLRSLFPEPWVGASRHLRQAGGEPVEAKECLWQRLLAGTPHDPGFALADTFPLPACPFARAHRRRRFKGETAFGTFGKGTLLKQTFYGFRGYARGPVGRALSPACRSLRPTPTSSRSSPNPPSAPPVCSSGIATTTRPGLRKSWPGGTLNCSHPTLLPSRARSHCRTECAVEPFSLPDRHRFFATRGTLLHKAGVARDLWHLMSRLLRKVLSHTVVFLLNHRRATNPFYSRSCSFDKLAHRVS
jgi:hypothetical protein